MSVISAVYLEAEEETHTHTQKIYVSSSPGRLKLVRNVILFGAAPPSRVSVIYENANYDANANTTE